MGERTKTHLQGDGALKTRFGATVKEFRRQLALSQEELAWRADMHRTYLADIERGGRNISLSNLVRLVRALGVSLTAFFQTLEHGPSLPGAQKRRTRTGAGNKTATKKRAGAARSGRG